MLSWKRLRGCIPRRLGIVYFRFAHLLKPLFSPKNKPSMHSIILLLNLLSSPTSALISNRLLPSSLLVLNVQIMMTGAN